MQNARELWVVLAVVAVLCVAGPARADVFNMGGGLTSVEFVTVGNAGNAADTRYATPGYGAVNYTYQMGKFEITAGQYTQFLNAVAKTDTYGLFSTDMQHSGGCLIERWGSIGSFTYTVAADWANRPVNYVSWGDAARFCNWLTNGQKSGVQDATTTEDGSYALNGAISDSALLAVTRKANAQYAIPSEDEWYKAAYYDPATSSYYDYATSSNTVPSNVLADPDLGNSANFVVPDPYYHDPRPTLGLPYYRTVVGEFENSASPYGTFDQSGNVVEWNEAISQTGSGRGLRGGGYGFTGDTLHASWRGGRAPSNDSYASGDGFRIAAVPEPTCGLLLLMGGAVVARRRRA